MAIRRPTYVVLLLAVAGLMLVIEPHLAAANGDRTPAQGRAPPTPSPPPSTPSLPPSRTAPLTPSLPPPKPSPPPPKKAPPPPLFQCNHEHPHPGGGYHGPHHPDGGYHRPHHHGDGGEKCNKWKKKGGVSGDPKIIGGDGVMFYFHGHKDQDFCLVSDSDLQINSHFIGKRPEGRTRDFTWVQALGFLFGPHTLTVSAKKVAQWDSMFAPHVVQNGGASLGTGW